MANFFDFNADFSHGEEESELIPLMTSDDEEAILKESLPDSVPILPLRNAVLFPGVVIPISATRDKSVKLIKHANSKNKLIGVVSQKDSAVSDPTINDINKIGTVAKILRVLQMPDGNLTIIIQGKILIVNSRFLCMHQKLIYQKYCETVYIIKTLILY